MHYVTLKCSIFGNKKFSCHWNALCDVWFVWMFYSQKLIDILSDLWFQFLWCCCSWWVLNFLIDFFLGIEKLNSLSWIYYVIRRVGPWNEQIYSNLACSQSILDQPVIWISILFYKIEYITYKKVDIVWQIRTHFN